MAHFGCKSPTVEHTWNGNVNYECVWCFMKMILEQLEAVQSESIFGPKARES